MNHDSLTVPAELANQWKIQLPPPNVGYWLLNGDDNYGTRFYVAKKPIWLHRTMIQWFFGFKWRDL